MIRTRLVELSTIEAAAYRRKLGAGHSGVVVMRYDTPQPGLASVNKRTGEANPADNVNVDLFPLQAFQEALELTSGMPYSRRGPVKLSGDPSSQMNEGPSEPDAPETLATIDSSEYAAILQTYTDKKGELSYALLNKDFIQFAKSSKFVASMVADGASVEDIVDHIVRAKLESITGNRNLTTNQTRLIVEMLDEVSPRQIFGELREEIKKMLGAGKR